MFGKKRRVIHEMAQVAYAFMALELVGDKLEGNEEEYVLKVMSAIEKYYPHAPRSLNKMAEWTNDKEMSKRIKAVLTARGII